MPFEAGQAKTPGSGRKPGTPNKRTQALWEQLEALGFREGTEDDPLILMWLWMAGRKSVVHHLTIYSEDEEHRPIGEEKVLEPASDEVRMHLAKELAPYLYAKLKAVDVTSGGEKIAPARVDYRALAKAVGVPSAKSGAHAAAKPQRSERAPQGAPRPE